MKPKGKELITLFDITLDAENKTNSMKKIKQYVKTIRNNNSKIKGLKIKLKKQNLNTDHLEYMIKYLDKMSMILLFII
jgi:hypothetical protein